jgi:hypothetical protein
MISKTSGALSTAQLIGSTNGSAGLLCFAQYCSVYDGTSTSAPRIVSLSTGSDGQVFTSPVDYGPNGLWVTPTSSATVAAVIHFK